MTDQEILRSYKQAKNPRKQISVLADLNPSIGKRGIYEALIRAGEKIQIPKNLLTEKEQEEEMEETTQVTPTVEAEPVKVDKRKIPWSEERKAAQAEKIKAGLAKKREEVKEWKPEKFDEPKKQELPIAGQVRVTETFPSALRLIIDKGMNAALKEADENLTNAKKIVDAYNDSVDFLFTYGMSEYKKVEIDLGGNKK